LAYALLLWFVENKNTEEDSQSYSGELKKGNQMKTKLDWLRPLYLLSLYSLSALVTQSTVTQASHTETFYPGSSNRCQTTILRAQFNESRYTGPRRTLNILSQFPGLTRGDRIESIRVTADTSQGGDARILVDRMVENASQFFGDRRQTAVFYLKSRQNVVGLDFQSLQLDLSGDFRLQEIAVEIQDRHSCNERQRPVQPDYIFARLNTEFVVGDRMNVNQILRLRQNYSGRAIQEILFETERVRGNLSAQLHVNGRAVGFAQSIKSSRSDRNSNSNTYRFSLPRNLQEIGSEVTSVEIQFVSQGNSGRGRPASAMITSVGANLERASAPAPRPPHQPRNVRVEKSLNQTVNGSAYFRLSEFFSARELEQVEVQTVEITLASRSGRNGNALICHRGSCSGDQAVDSRMRTYRFTVPNQNFGNNGVIRLQLTGDLHMNSIALVGRTNR
jgi:hypothetical protein